MGNKPTPRKNLRGAYRPKSMYNRRQKPGVSAYRQLNIAPGVGGQTSFRHRWTPDRRALTMERVGAINAYSVNASVRIDVPSGFQNAFCFDIAQETLLRQIMSASTTGAIQTMNQYALASQTTVFQFANNSTSGAHVDIYDVVYKRDTPVSFTNGTGSTYTKNSALTFWQAGLQDQDTASAATAWQQILCKPSASRTFRDYVKVLKVRRILMGAGSTHEHRVSTTYNKLISSDLVNNGGGALGSSGVYNFRNISQGVLIVAYGNPCSSGSDEAGNVVVSTAPLAIDCVQQQQYNYTWVNDKSNTWNATDNLSSFAPGVGNIIAPAWLNTAVQISSP
jgi:hypothetical protein